MTSLVHAARPWPAGGVDRRVDWPRLARAAAALHLLALVLIVMIAWQDGAAAGGLPGPDLAVLIATGAAAALLALRPGERAALGVTETGGTEAAIEAGPRLVAQMSHELRTPLNAVIGFSEVMLRELYGPLGHARYQEYAACISESGERLLRASEDTLAVAATMSALMADRRAIGRERVSAATLLQEAWAAAAEPGCRVLLAAVGCGSGEIECDGRATGQALEHLLREAIARTPPDGTVEVSGCWGGGIASIAIEVRGERGADPSPHDEGQTPRDRPANESPWLEARGLTAFNATGLPPFGPRGLTPSGGVHVVLARSLLEMQGAALSLRSDALGVWRACVAFPATRCRIRAANGDVAPGRLQKASAAAPCAL